MMIHEVTAIAGKYKQRKRIGRGVGSGNGKTAGRGMKGAGARTGHSKLYQFEGGQMPFFRRMPKFGFTNANFKTKFWTVNLGAITAHADFKNGGEVNHETLIKAGLVRDTSRDLKILGGLEDGQDKLNVKLDVKTNRVTDSARKLIVDAGGSVHESGTRRDRVRGVDRNSDDRSPKNLTKKLKNQDWHRKREEAFARGEVIKQK
ncbi:MAG: 50S ribosomal protein L15 [Phycisphaerales bacterium]|jgi:large subunit ribosomal protein L15|nr:50S ribosomal protein L15 [Phycisphaerales bacterium]